MLYQKVNFSTTRFPIPLRTGLTQKSSEVAVIHELPLRQIRFLRQFCVSPKEVGNLVV